MPYGFITKIKNIRPHSNADRLMIGECFGNQVIIGKDVEEGQLGVYFATDSQLSERFANANNLVRKKDEHGNNIGGYLEPDKRHIKALKLRGEISDGLFMSMDSLASFGNIKKLSDGDCIDTFNGVEICRKYVPKVKSFSGATKSKSKKPMQNQFPFFYEHKDTSQLAYCLSQFRTGDYCILTSKIHGTSGRTSNALKVKRQSRFITRLYDLFKVEPKRQYELVTGSRRVTLDMDKDMKDGYYNTNEFRKKWHEFFNGKLMKGETVYYEIVGWVDENTTIMPQCANKKTNDKEFVKQYGDITTFSYGCKQGKNDIFVYRMTMTNEDGEIIEYTWEQTKTRCMQMGVKHVLELDKFFFTTEEDLMSRVNSYLDSPDPIDPTHIIEGVVVKIENRPTFTAYKHKSFAFKVLEGIIKTDDVVDMEEAQDTE